MTLLAFLTAIACVIVAPAAAASWSGSAAGRSDSPVRVAYAFGGLGVSCWSIWAAAQVWGIDARTVLCAPLIVSGLLLGARAATGQPHVVSVGRADRCPRIVWMAALLIGLLVPFLPYGLVTGGGVHRMAMSDWYKHLMVTTALVGGEFPPPNAFLAAASEAPYYYGFHLVAAALEVVGRFEMTFGLLLMLAVLTAAAYPIVLFVVARDLFDDARRAATAAVAGTFLAGFDVVVWVVHTVRDTVTAWPIPDGFAGLRAAVPMTSLDFWIHHNERQFAGPYVTAIWAPHHLAAVVLALLVVRQVCLVPTGPRWRLLPVVLLASIPAISVYVALTLCVGICAVVAADAWRVRRPPWATPSGQQWARVGIPAFVLSLPVLSVFAGGSQSALAFGISSAGTLFNGAVFTALIGDGALTRLFDTPILYLVELGLVGALGLAGIIGRVSRGTLSTEQRALAVLTAAIVVFVTLVRPPVDGPNNLYARPMILVWSVLACFAADAWCAVRRIDWRHVAGVALSVAGTVFGVVGVTAEAVFWTTSPETVAALRWINTNAPRHSVVAYEPQRGRHGYWLRRPVVVDDRRLALLFGASGAQYDAVRQQLDYAYEAGSPDVAADRFDRLGADVIVVDMPPPIWARPPCFDRGYEGEHMAVVTRVRPACAGGAE